LPNIVSSIADNGNKLLPRSVLRRRKQATLQPFPLLRPWNRAVCKSRSDWFERRGKFVAYVVNPTLWIDPLGLDHRSVFWKAETFAK